MLVYYLKGVNSLSSSFANSQDPDVMLHNATLQQ